MENTRLNAKMVKSLGFQQQEVADALGISRSALQTYLYGQVAFPHELREKICHFLGIEYNVVYFERETIQHDDRDTTSRSRELIMPREISRRDFLSHLSPTSYTSETLVQILTTITRMTRANIQDCKTIQWTLTQKMGEIANSTENIDPLRRHILLTIAALPIGFFVHDALASTGATQLKRCPIDEGLANCSASLAACWHLMALGGEDIVQVERYIVQYFPFLQNWAEQSDLYQSAAYCASQACLLLGLVALHTLPPQLNTQERLLQCQRAVHYARIAKDNVLLATTLAHYGNALYDTHDKEAMLHAYGEADSYRATLPETLQSKLSLELAHAYAQHGQTDKALNALALAHNLFPGSVEAPPFLQNDYGKHSLILFSGLIYQDLGMGTQNKKYIHSARKALEGIDTPTSHVIPQRFLAEIRNQQALTAVHAHDYEGFEFYLKLGIEDAKKLHSGKRRQEAFSILLTAGRVWPRETHKILQLAELFI